MDQVEAKQSRADDLQILLRQTKDGRGNITAIRRELTIIQDKLLKRSIRNTISPIPHMPSWTQLCKRGILYSTSQVVGNTGKLPGLSSSEEQRQVLDLPPARSSLQTQYTKLVPPTLDIFITKLLVEIPIHS